MYLEFPQFYSFFVFIIFFFNHVVCHGIPSEKTLQDGDIVNIDITSFIDGFHGDASRMYSVGKPSVKAKKLINVTYDSLMKAINILKPGITLGDIGFAIQNFVEQEGFSVVRDFCGHGIGTLFHEEPSILHYGRKNEGMTIKEGMVFTIEPMINAGNYQTRVLNDGWTAVTKDKSLSAQFEHTVGITKNGCEIFTLSDKFDKKVNS
jgi:methionyl aminopeptidase